MWSIKRFLKKSMKPTQSEVVETFKSSFESDNAIDMAIDVTDLAIDKFIDSDAINGVPVIGLLNASYKVYKNVQAYRLAKKVYLFLYHTNELKIEQKRQFVEDYIESNQEDGIDALLSVIDQLDNQNKVEILANLLKAKIEGKISIFEFNRLVSCLQRVPFSDINRLKDYMEDHYEPGVTEVLYAAGFLYLSHEDFENSTNEYKLNHNGVQLLKYGIGHEVEMPTDFKVKRLSFVTTEEVDDIIDEKIEGSKPRLEDETLIFPDGTKSGKNEDDGQFLYDLARGK